MVNNTQKETKTPKYNNQILNEREKTHGDFARVAECRQRLKAVLDLNSDYTANYVQKEAIDMICTKLARIRCGDPNEIDHWKDIAGYAELVVKDLEF